MSTTTTRTIAESSQTRCASRSISPTLMLEFHRFPLPVLSSHKLIIDQLASQFHQRYKVRTRFLLLLPSSKQTKKIERVLRGFCREMHTKRPNSKIDFFLTTLNCVTVLCKYSVRFSKRSMGFIRRWLIKILERNHSETVYIISGRSESLNPA